MSYQVLARKWRPRNFAALKGQEHVVRALGNALAQQKLHHALLFTGTRGVGKTTVARIVAKSLNCAEGISATPCGVCSNCTDIDAGRFPDLLEIDAASRTKVDDTRELLDSVIYAPSRGRYKVYLIDEVHMLSTSSFNALLKTLEEPPPHVQFVLATTDPQKLPVTVLSRCLKFHLRRLSIEQIEAQMTEILRAENLPFDPAAISEIARAADGSMRDGLSLLDQAIADGNGELALAGTLEMLGTVASDRIETLLHAVFDNDREAVSTQLAAIAQAGPAYKEVVARLLDALHQVALVQVIGDALRPAPAPAIVALAAKAPPEVVQVDYSLALKGWREVQDAPDPSAAFAMLILRLLAFRPSATGTQLQSDGAKSGVAASAPSRQARSTHAATPASADDAVAPARTQPTPASAAPLEVSSPTDWTTLVETMSVQGPGRALATHCLCRSFDAARIELCVAVGHEDVRSAFAERTLLAAIAERMPGTEVVFVEQAAHGKTTKVLIDERLATQQANAEAAIVADPVVRALSQELGGRIVAGSITANPNP